jgi:hypothetical protein
MMQYQVVQYQNDAIPSGAMLKGDENESKLYVPNFGQKTRTVSAGKGCRAN